MILNVNARGDLTEIDTQNNIQIWQVKVVIPNLGDLVVNTIANPISVGIGQLLNVSWTVENQGSYSVSGYLCDALFYIC